ncbi:MAG: leucyl aminopeptidase [Candidatus Marinimicrobia bacterium]|jgi:leucyl aminopeptidase|nr:leucyl aminopeptidase [Candidatus Neomarinimicrobiota bacterium]MBT7822137.1 leucyl aminopeptidase [Candidatus Neomarinimicrobiota bacterium]
MAHISIVNSTKKSWNETDARLIAVGIYQDKKFTPMADAINQASNGAFTEAIELGDVKGKTGESHLFYVDGKRILLLGLGKKDKFDSNAVQLVAGTVSRTALHKKIDSVAMECFCEDCEHCQSCGEGLVLGSYQFIDYKTGKDDGFILKSATVLGCDSPNVAKGAAIGNSVCFARDLANHPGNTTTPSRLAEAAKEIADEGGMKLTVFDREEFTDMGMGALAGVALGTDEPPKFIILEYMNGGDAKPKIIVGKGLTFDAGGISIKPAGKMDEMKYDMCGSATVLGTMKAIAALKPKINVVCIVPSTENLLGAKAYKPGDILKAYNGKTIEVLNTDAEGRLILADALAYASKHYDPEYILDFATLTGAVLVTLGHIATGVMGTDDSLMNKIKLASKSSGEKIWEFPLWPEFCKQIKSDIADVKNMGTPGQAGSIAGGAFLKEFVGEDIPWVHFDIAGTAWGSKTTSVDPKGSATGWGVRLVLDMLNS